VTGEGQGDAELRAADAPDNEAFLLPDRSCGTCNLCCKVYSIAELNKAAGQWCVHAVRGGGCGNYLNRPESCRKFFCSWRVDPNLGPEWKPEVSRFVLSTDPVLRAMTITVDPGMPLAWKREPYYPVLKRFSEVFFRLDQKVLAILRGHITVILPDRDVSVGLVISGDQIDIWREGQVYGATLRRGSARSSQSPRVLGSM
jgi:hypothetical protein